MNVGLAWARYLGAKHAHKPFPLTSLQSKTLDMLGYSAWMAYKDAKAKAEGIPNNRVWY